MIAGGCSPKAPSELRVGNSTPSTANVIDPDNLTHDVGQVIAGETVSHDFLVENIGDSALAIQSDDDIRLGCGCTSLIPEARRLEPGSKTQVRMTVRTQGFNGPFDKGGSIVWTAANGEKRVVQMALSGVVIPPLRAEPEVIRFEPNDGPAGVVKKLQFGEGVSLDWSTFSLQSSSPNVKVSISHRDKQAAVCAVQCAVPEGLETFSAIITATAKIADPASALKGTEVSLTVPVAARQAVDLLITPKLVPVTFRGPNGWGIARLLLRGTLLESENPVLKCVHCEGFEVEWKLNQGSAAKAAVLEIVLKPQDKTVKPHPEITIEVEGKGTFRFPIVAMGARPT